MLVLALLACGSPPPAPAPVPEVAPAPDPAEAALQTAREAVPALAGGLKSRLQAAMAQGGPEAAVTVCADEAQAITKQFAAERGVVIGRSSLRLRNPANTAPDWVTEWLRAQGERPAEGVTGFARVDEAAGGRVARVLKPIPVEAPCLACHGPAEGLPPGVKAVLAEKYPSDAATGYAVGDLRGVVWAEVPVR